MYKIIESQTGHGYDVVRQVARGMYQIVISSVDRATARDYLRELKS